MFEGQALARPLPSEVMGRNAKAATAGRMPIVAAVSLVSIPLGKYGPGQNLKRGDRRLIFPDDLATVPMLWLAPPEPLQFTEDAYTALGC